MAIDEAVLNARIGGLSVDTLRFYRWKPSAVSIGRFQKVESEVQLENCAERGVDVVRRVTGGGAVYHDTEDEITYSVIANKESLEAKDVGDVYAKIYAGLTEALKILGVTADFNEGGVKACPNLTVKGRKISGSAQCHRRGVVLQHGTILVKVNLEKMFTYLRVPWAQSCMQVADIARHRITSLYDELGKNVSIGEMNHALIKGFQQALNTRLIEDELTLQEFELAERFRKERYATADWNIYGKGND
jgi:lipoate-protein ligase A